MLGRPCRRYTEARATYGNTRAGATHGNTRGPGRSDLHRRTVGGGGGIGREVRIVDEIKLERRAESRVRGYTLPRGALP